MNNIIDKLYTPFIYLLLLLLYIYIYIYCSQFKYINYYKNQYTLSLEFKIAATRGGIDRM